MGKEQASILAAALQAEGPSIEALFCSPLIRAKETAEIVGKQIGLQPEIINELRERNNYGILTGMRKSEAKEKYPTLVEDLKTYRHGVPESESYEVFGDRIKQAWNFLLARNSKAIAVVAHGGPISFIFREILKAGEATIDDCGYAVIEARGGDLQIKRLQGISMSPQ